MTTRTIENASELSNKVTWQGICGFASHQGWERCLLLIRQCLYTQSPLPSRYMGLWMLWSFSDLDIESLGEGTVKNWGLHLSSELSIWQSQDYSHPIGGAHGHQRIVMMMDRG
jgi:hypothetical protein